MDAGLTRMVVMALAAMGCLSIGGVVITQAAGHEPRPILEHAITACITGLLGMLVPTGGRAQRHDEQQDRKNQHPERDRAGGDAPAK